VRRETEHHHPPDPGGVAAMWKAASARQHERAEDGSLAIGWAAQSLARS